MKEWVCCLQLLLALAAQSFSGPTPAGLMTTFYCLRFETPQPGGPGPPILYPPKQGGQLYPQVLGSLFVAS
jgi:hypothetical protein